MGILILITLQRHTIKLEEKLECYKVRTEFRTDMCTKLCFMNNSAINSFVNGAPGTQRISNFHF